MRIQQHRRRRTVSSPPTIITRVGLLLRLCLLFCCCICNITPTSAKKGQLELSKECQSHWRRNPVRIDAVYLVCDSPGAYYGGKSAYQNSITCRQGDRAKVALDFSVLGKWDYTLGMNLTIEASFYGITHLIQDHTDICYFGSLTFTGSDNDDDNVSYKHVCPLQTGSYELYTTFTVPNFQPDATLDFTPDLYVEFADARNERNLLGCASTGTVALLHNGTRRAKRGKIAFMWCFVCLMILFSSCFIVHRRKKGRSYIPPTTTNDYRNSPGNNQASASIMQRYQYRQTTRNGTVLVPQNFENSGFVAPQLPSNPDSSASSLSSGVGKLRQRLDEDNGEGGSGSVNLTSLGFAGFGGEDPGRPNNNNNEITATMPIPTSAPRPDTSMLEMT